MLILRNNTQSVSKIGYAVALDPRDAGAFVYAIPSSTKLIGIITEVVDYRKPCKIATIGENAKIFVAGNIAKGDIIRLGKTGENLSLGVGVRAKPADAPYLKIGDALNTGSGLISCVLELSYAGDAYGTGYVPYGGATKNVDLGSKAILSGSSQTGSDTDYVNIDPNGNLTLKGDATVWDDLRILYGVVDVPGGTDPDINDWRPTGSGTTFKVYAFAKGDQFFFTQQLPHDYKEGSDLYPHVHWTPGARGVAENAKVVQWRLDYTIQNNGSNFPVSTTVALPGICSGVNDRHEKTTAGSISGVGLTISSQLVGHFYRYNNVSDTWVGVGINLPIFLELDMHYEKDALGSQTRTTK